MTLDELAVTVKDLQGQVAALQKEKQALQQKVNLLEDTENIKKLQRAYGFYLEHWMSEDLADCFADGDDTTLIIAAGTFKGKEEVRRLFLQGNPESKNELAPYFMHQVMQLSGVVNVAPDGMTAKGRWYGFGANAFPKANGKVAPGWMNGIYEVKYVKQKGIWKMQVVRWCMTFHAPWTLSFVHPEQREDVYMNRPYEDKHNVLKPTDLPEETQWPSGFICPFHFENPVSGRKTHCEG